MLVDVHGFLHGALVGSGGVVLKLGCAVHSGNSHVDLGSGHVDSEWTC